ncbi:MULTISPECIES: XRE family transcriptional regulator [unclassified Streptomyces]|uniref:XRE family transcriptional regulator n=1 Tax=unclassified Streptomyces TaxID=2593676 RepID=UPI002E764727|nr:MULTISPECIES: XRE family transcriptional regulator [unclassified Streptomyces]
MTESQLARVCGVDPKTVGRWISNPTREPHARHRAAASRVLGEEEIVLWPSVQQLVKSGPDRELVQMYPYRSAAPATLWRQLIRGATRELTFAGYTNYFLWLEHANFGALLRQKTEQGVRVRFILGEPGHPITRQRELEEDVPLTLSTRIEVTLSELAKLRDTSIAARYETGHVSLSVFRFDTDMIVTPLLPGRTGHDAPMMHLRRAQDDGVFDRFAGHTEELWAKGRDVWTIPTTTEAAHAQA